MSTGRTETRTPDIEVTTSFSRLLKQRRAALDLTQVSLAEQAGCAVETIRAFETGRRRPSRAMADRLAGVLAITAEEQADWMRLARSLAADPATSSGRGPDAGELEPAPPRRAAQLPVPLTALIGRAAELEAVRRRLDEPGCRLLTLIGSGGIGKTRLAIEVAAEREARYADGAAWVALAPITTAEHVGPAIADALGCSLPPLLPPDEALVLLLRERELLLVLDNLEHLLESTALLHAIMRRAPGVQLLVTSRERLRLEGERVVELGGLPMPRDETPAAVERCAAVMLFVDRARQVQGDWALTASNRGAVATVCRLLDGLPLGIELAAAWTRVLSPDEIAGELARDLDFLALSDRDTDPRHRSMRAVIDYSWTLLTPEEQRAMAALSTFRGGLTRDAAATVAGAGLPLLAALLDKSLLRRVPGGRYELHELLRQYAAARLAADPEAERAGRERHAAYFAAWIDAREPLLKGPQQHIAAAELAAEIDNLRAAWNAAVDLRLTELLRRMAFGASLLWFFEMQGRYRECEAMCRRAADALRTVPAPAPVDELLLAHLTATQGGYACRCGRPAEGLPLLEQSLPVLRRGDDPQLLVFALTQRLLLAMYAGELERVRALLDELVSAAQRSGDPWLKGIAQFSGAIAVADPQPELAFSRIGDILPDLRALGDRNLLGPSLNYLGEAALTLGKVDAAEQAFGELLQGSAEVGLRHGEVAGRTGLARVASARQAWSEAIALALEAVAGSRTIGDLSGQVKALLALGEAEAGGGDRPAARDTLREALSISLSGRMLPMAIDAWLGLAALDVAAGERPPLLLPTLALVREHSATRRASAARAAALWATLAAEGDAPAPAARSATRPAAPDQLPRMLLAYAEGRSAAGWEDAAAPPGASATPAARRPSGAVLIRDTGETLSRRELEVLRLIAAGANNALIAEQLVISIHTVKTHVASLLAKLGVASRTAAALRARDLGLAA